ncbi:MAG: OmpA family protein [Dissulfuribacterales bacterium]
MLNYLSAKGVPDSHLSVVGYGEASSIALNQTKEGQDENRRSEIRVVGSLLPDIALTNLESLPAGTTIEVINFNYGEDRLLPIYRSLLDKSIPLINENPTIKFEVAGFADSSGVAKKNVALSLKRANNVKNYLVSKGVPKDRLTTTVYATLQPIVTNETSIRRGFNRRVEIKTME